MVVWHAVTRPKPRVGMVSETAIPMLTRRCAS
jgi:hypothetical protein